VIVIDERVQQHFGGEVAAPVFREVMLDLQRLPRGPLDPNLQQVVVRPVAPGRGAGPAIVALLGGGARLDPMGLHLHIQATGLAFCFAAARRGGVDRARAARDGAGCRRRMSSASRLMPDLLGTTLREAMRRLWRVDVAVGFHGDGSLVRQSPLARRAAAERSPLWSCGASRGACVRRLRRAAPAVGRLAERAADRAVAP